MKTILFALALFALTSLITACATQPMNPVQAKKAEKAMRKHDWPI